MITVNPNATCEQAQAYYYEYLRGQGQERITTKIFAYMDKCRFCQAGINQLKIIQAESEKHTAESIGQTNSAITY